MATASLTPAGLFLAVVSWGSGSVVVLILGSGIVATLVQRLKHRFNPSSRRVP